MLNTLTTARHLEEIANLKLFKNAALELHKVVGDHDGEQGLAVGVDGHRQSGGLHQNHISVDDCDRSREKIKEEKDGIKEIQLTKLVLVLEVNKCTTS